jgi:hypothetical protein
MSPGDGAPAPTVGANLGGVGPAEIGAFYEKEMPRLVLFVTVSTGLDAHASADVAQTAFERALPRWAALRNPRAWLYRVAHNEAIARGRALCQPGLPGCGAAARSRPAVAGVRRRRGVAHPGRPPVAAVVGTGT